MIQAKCAMENKSFVMIPRAVLSDGKISANAKLLLAEIFSLSQSTGYAYANNAYFAKLFETTPRSVKRWLSELEDLKYIRFEYEFVSNKSGRKIYLGVTFLSIWGDRNVPPPRDKSVTHININNNKKDNKTSSPSADEIQPCQKEANEIKIYAMTLAETYASKNKVQYARKCMKNWSDLGLKNIEEIKKISPVKSDKQQMSVASGAEQIISRNYSDEEIRTAFKSLETLDEF